MVLLEVKKTETGTRRLLIPKLLWEEFFGDSEIQKVLVRFPKHGRMVVDKISEDDTKGLKLEV